jgi:hypothetical protein
VYAINIDIDSGVFTSYGIYTAPGNRLKELLSLDRLNRHQDFWAPVWRHLRGEAWRNLPACVMAPR